MNKLKIVSRLITSVFIGSLALVSAIDAYPTDANEVTKIQRLTMISQADIDTLPKGARWPSEKIQLRLLEKNVTIPLTDQTLSNQIIELLGEDKDNYGFSLLDLSNINSPTLAEFNGNVRFNPGSVGKLIVGLAFLQTLADQFPDSLEARQKFLRETILTADPLIISDDHVVAIIENDPLRLTRRPLMVGDKGNIWSYLDWMFSASSNAASSMVLKELVLLHDFNKNYQELRLTAEDYLKQRKKTQLGDSLKQALQESLKRNNLDTEKLQQGGFFTHTGKAAMPGTKSYATPNALIQFLLLMEQGKLVDQFSSLELKRLLYHTQKRIRYASSPALSDQAVFFKSGSLYRCKPEVDFKCRKYQGNVENLLNSVAIVESSSDAETPVYYMVVITSNVLRKNSAVAHQTLATRIHHLIVARHRSLNPIDQKK